MEIFDDLFNKKGLSIFMTLKNPETTKFQDFYINLLESVYQLYKRS